VLTSETTKKQTPPKKIWEGLCSELDKVKWQPRSQPWNKFRHRFKINPLTIREIVREAAKNKKLKTRYPLGIVLMALLYLRGTSADDLANEFGGGRESARKAVNLAFTIVDGFSWIFATELLTEREAKDLKKSLEKEGAVSPDEHYIGKKSKFLKICEKPRNLCSRSVKRKFFYMRKIAKTFVLPVFCPKTVFFFRKHAKTEYVLPVFFFFQACPKTLFFSTENKTEYVLPVSCPNYFFFR